MNYSKEEKEQVPVSPSAFAVMGLPYKIGTH